MATLYVTEQGARVEKEHLRLLVTREDEVLLAVPLARVSHVVLVGQVGITTPALLALLQAGVGLSLVSRAGRLVGRLEAPAGKNIALRHAQYRQAMDGARCLAVSRAIVAGKLANCRAIARRRARGWPDGAAEQIGRINAALDRVESAPDLAALRGIEGEGTRSYFAVWRRALQPGVPFGKRSRRPPADPANALLSLGYTLLAANLMAACEVAGLDPYDGFYHADRYGRPALALDLMEEFRPVIVDSLVLNLVNREMLSAEDFEEGTDGGVYLRQAGLRTFSRQYTSRLNAQVLHPETGRRLTYQKWFEVQAMAMRRVIEGALPDYRPMVTR